MRVQFPSVTKKRSELINYFISKHPLTSNKRREFKTRSLGTRHNGLSVYDLSDRILSGFHMTIFKNLNLILKKLIWEQNYFRSLCSRARKDMKITQQTIYHCYSSLLVKCLSSLRFKFLRYLPFTPQHHHHHHQPPSPLPTPARTTTIISHLHTLPPSRRSPYWEQRVKVRKRYRVTFNFYVYLSGQFFVVLQPKQRLKSSHTKQWNLVPVIYPPQSLPSHLHLRIKRNEIIELRKIYIFSCSHLIVLKLWKQDNYENGNSAYARMPHFFVFTTKPCFGVKLPLTSKRGFVAKSGNIMVIVLHYNSV